MDSFSHPRSGKGSKTRGTPAIIPVRSLNSRFLTAKADSE